MTRCIIALFCLLGLAGCLFPSPDLLAVDLQDIYFEATPGAVRVTVTNPGDEKIELRRLRGEDRSVFYDQPHQIVLEPGQAEQITLPFTPQWLNGDQLTFRIRYALYDAVADRWPPPGEDLTAQVSRRVDVDALPFSFPDARRAAGFMPVRYRYLLRGPKAWLFESPAGQTFFLNGTNIHIFDGRWYPIALKVEQATTASVALDFVVTDPALAEQISGRFDATSNGTALTIHLPVEKLVRFVRFVKKQGYRLSDGPADGALTLRPSGDEAAAP